MWIVFNALLLYNIAVISGRFDAFRDWLLDALPNDRRVVLVVIGFCFGCLLEGIAGFGVPVAITSALLDHDRHGAPGSTDHDADIQHRSGRLRCAGSADYDARAGHRPAGREARCDGGSPAALHRRHPALLCHGHLRRPAFGPCTLAGPRGCRIELCAGAVLHVELPRLFADRRVGGARVVGRNLRVSADMVPASRSPACDSTTHARRPWAPRRRCPHGRGGFPGSSSPRSSSSGRTSKSPPSTKRPFIGPACTMRYSSRSTTRPMRPIGRSSRSGRARPYWSRPSSRPRSSEWDRHDLRGRSPRLGGKAVWPFSRSC